MHYLIVIGLICLSSAALAQAPKQKSSPAKNAPSSVEIAADPESTSASYGDWALVCRRLKGAQKPTCQVTQQIQVQGQPGPIAQLAFARDGTSQKLRLVLVLPANVTIPTAPTVANGDANQHELKLAWLRCVPGGCLAEAVPADDIVKVWRRSSEGGRIAFRDGLGRDIAVPMSFRGLAPALDALMKQN